MTEPLEHEEAKMRHALQLLTEALELEVPTLGSVHVASLSIHPSRRRWLQGLTGIAAVLLVGVGLAALISQDTKTSKPAASGKALTNRFEAIACAKQIVVGKTVSVEPGSVAGTETVTFRVAEWIKPATGPAQLKFVDTPDATTNGQYPAWDTDLRRLLYVPWDEEEIISQLTDQYEDLDPIILSVKQELPKGLATECPLPSS